MNTAVFCQDVDGSAPIREREMQAHFRHIEAALADILLAGPLYDASGAHVVGSLFLLRTADLAAARRLIEADPYFAAGVWRSIEYRPFLAAAGDYIGGKIW